MVAGAAAPTAALVVVIVTVAATARSVMRARAMTPMTAALVVVTVATADVGTVVRALSAGTVAAGAVTGRPMLGTAAAAAAAAGAPTAATGGRGGPVGDVRHDQAVGQDRAAGARRRRHDAVVGRARIRRDARPQRLAVRQDTIVALPQPISHALPVLLDHLVRHLAPLDVEHCKYAGRFHVVFHLGVCHVVVYPNMRPAYAHAVEGHARVLDRWNEECFHHFCFMTGRDVRQDLVDSTLLGG